ncbi:MAG: TIGR04283 family arsenosugar biosynthesis glycosyltransferase [Pseudomonadota bacterium]
MISVIIPTLNEATRLPALLSRLGQEPVDHEVIVVDGGSDDATPSIALDAGVTLLQSDPGRGQQLARGAQVANGNVLLFLHADSQFPADGLVAIEQTLARDATCVGGNFRVIFDGDTSFAEWLTGFYAWFRARGLYYGDSGIFVRSRVYQSIGGIRPIDLMEDYDFSRRLERAGKTCCLDEPALVTSSRRFEGRSPTAIVAGWLLLHGLFHLGISPRLLARYYAWQCRRRRQRTPITPQHGVEKA